MRSWRCSRLLLVGLWLMQMHGASMQCQHALKCHVPRTDIPPGSVAPACWNVCESAAPYGLQLLRLRGGTSNSGPGPLQGGPRMGDNLGPWDSVEPWVPARLWKEIMQGAAGAQKGLVARLSIPHIPFLHLGHARAALLNDYFARNYNGTLLVRFEDILGDHGPLDDDAVLQDLAILGVKVDRTAHASDYREELMAACELAIRQGRAYVTETCVGGINDTRLDVIISAHRNSTVVENLARWAEMVAGSDKYCVRARLDLNSQNHLLRDPVLFYSTPSSWPQGSRPICCPTPAFSVPVLDHAHGVTYVILAASPSGRAEQYAAICKVVGIHSTPRFCLVDKLTQLGHTPLNTHFLQGVISNGQLTPFEGTVDPRLPTLRGLMRLGVRVCALRVFSLLTSGIGRQIQSQPKAQGVNADDDLSIGTDEATGISGARSRRAKINGRVEDCVLWGINRRVLESEACPRFTALETDGICKMMLRNLAEEEPTNSGACGDAAGNAHVSTLDTVLIEEFDASSIREGDKMTLVGWTSEGVSTNDWVTGWETDASGRCGGTRENRAGHFRVASMQFDREGNPVRVLGDLLSENPELETTHSFYWLPDDLPHGGEDGRARGSLDEGGRPRLIEVTLQYETPVGSLHGRRAGRRHGAPGLGRSEDEHALEEEEEEDEGVGFFIPQRQSAGAQAQAHLMHKRDESGNKDERSNHGAKRYLEPGLQGRRPAGEKHTHRDQICGAPRRSVAAVGEAEMRKLKRGEVIRLERKGFFIVDGAVADGAPQMGAEGVSGDSSCSRAHGMRLLAIPSGMVVRRYSAADAAETSSWSSDECDDVAQQEDKEQEELAHHRSAAGDLPAALC